jgi:hypothetical protein
LELVLKHTTQARVLLSGLLQLLLLLLLLRLWVVQAVLEAGAEAREVTLLEVMQVWLVLVLVLVLGQAVQQVVVDLARGSRAVMRWARGGCRVMRGVGLLRGAPSSAQIQRRGVAWVMSAPLHAWQRDLKRELDWMRWRVGWTKAGQRHSQWVKWHGVHRRRQRAAMPRL